MNDFDEKLVQLIKLTRPVDGEKLKKQQKYYQRLSNKGITQKQTYNLKPISAI